MDNDGDMDFILIGRLNDHENVAQIWRNGTNGSPGLFSNQTASLAPSLEAVSTGSVNWVDMDNDGDMDLFITGAKFTNGGFGGGQEATCKILRNDISNLELPGKFVDVTLTWAPGIPAISESAVSWADADNDGDMDFILIGATGIFTNTFQMWRNDLNTPAKNFTNQTTTMVVFPPGENRWDV